MVRKFLRKNKKAIVLVSVGALTGALAGFFYWKNIGCNSGTCAIWSNPTKSTLYGAMLGAMFLFSFAPDSSKTKNS